MLQQVVSVCVEVGCQKQQIYCIRWQFLDFAVANFFMQLLVSLSFRGSCYILYRIRLFSLFCLWVFFCLFCHLKFRK